MTAYEGAPVVSSRAHRRPRGRSSSWTGSHSCTPTPGRVIDSIDKIVAWSIANSSRMGYFAALYKRITLAVGWKSSTPRSPTATSMHSTGISTRTSLTGRRRWGRQLSLLTEASNGEPIIVQHLLGACNGGGIPVAWEVAGALHAPLEAFIVRKPGAQDMAELRGRLRNKPEHPLPNSLLTIASGLLVGSVVPLPPPPRTGRVSGNLRGRQCGTVAGVWVPGDTQTHSSWDLFPAPARKLSAIEEHYLQTHLAPDS